MVKRITLSRIIVFFLLSSAVDAQSNSLPAASPIAPFHNWDQSFAPVVVALVCAFFFIGCFAVYLHHCSDMELAVGDPTGAPANCSSRGPQGVDPKLLDTFPILVYSAVKNLKFGKTAALECAVCLSEFDHQDTLRLLPKCNHVFHPQCIDAWFASHETCPVCRARLKPTEEEPRQGENEVVIVIPNEPNSHQVFDESSEGRTELHLADRTSLERCHSTGHSLGLGEIKGKETVEYNLRLSEDVMRGQIPVNHGKMRRSASCDVFRGRHGDQESSRENLIL
ncbi:E3 ubiquitin-protein ligase ATL31-like [Neltuma alba]|uniref:E3 ubiquitin-protein ligase ATL31-like n=1 Tax=Neltuma alba TaxID=207710 RepID=UPI0010A3D8C4|nr:E3 ubiquitin-protein ligase ATL31-like [Prosopis alba]